MKKCLYCKQEIPDDSVIDFCRRCGIGVFGERMLNTIIENMNKAREKGDLYQGITSFQGKEKFDSKDKFQSGKSF